MGHLKHNMFYVPHHPCRYRQLARTEFVATHRALGIAAGLCMWYLLYASLRLLTLP